MSHEGGHGVAVTGGGDLQKAVKLVGGGEAGDKAQSKSIDDGLYCHTTNGNNDILKGNGKSEPHQSADHPRILYHAAEAFGTYQNLLSDYPAETLFETIPNFHNTVSRYADFLQAIEDNKAGRLGECTEEIEIIKAHENYAHIIVDALASGEIPLRVTHNDTKLNNIMIDDKTGEGICVIDLDTVMPGSLLYDYGDSIRFAACNSAEDETDLSKVFLRLDLFEEYTEGFLMGVGKNITAKEIELLPVSAFILTYEVVLRFLGDYLNGDTYFQVHRDKHNLERARTQLTLALDIEKKLPEMAEIVKKYVK